MHVVTSYASIAHQTAGSFDLGFVYGTLRRRGVEFIPYTQLSEIDGDEVVLTDLHTAEQTRLTGIDAVVTSVGNVAADALSRELDTLGVTAASIGDCQSPPTDLQRHLGGRARRPRDRNRAREPAGEDGDVTCPLTPNCSNCSTSRPSTRCCACRGVDRLDKELVLSCFHPDTPDTHLGLGGKLYTGTIEEYLNAELPKFRDTIAGVMHYIMNFLCDVDGDHTVVETYQLSSTWGKDPADPRVNMQNSNRYIDHFERRNGQWRISERILLRNYTYSETRPAEFPDAINGWPPYARDRSDPAYRSVRDYLHEEAVDAAGRAGGTHQGGHGRS